MIVNYYLCTICLGDSMVKWKKKHTTRIYAKHSKGERAGNKNKLTNEATKFVNFISNQNATIPLICKMIIKKNVRCTLSFTQKPWQLYTSVWLLFRWSLKSRVSTCINGSFGVLLIIQIVINYPFAYKQRSFTFHFYRRIKL